MKTINKLISYLEMLPHIVARKKFSCESFVLVTASDHSHFKSLQNFLASTRRHEAGSRVIVYDLGLTEEQLRQLSEQLPERDIRQFTYTNYPSHFEITKNAGQYAWKPVIISEVLSETKGCVCWMDAGNILTKKLTTIRRFLQTIGMYSPHSNGTLADWTHPAMLNYLACPKSLTRERNRNGACIAINYENRVARNVVDSWKECALEQSCIAPTGSDRSNHRQDQSAFSILAYKSGIARRMPSRCYGFLTHQDAD